MKLAVVGAGVSGANIVRTLLNHPNFTTNDTIDVFEPREELGPGMPYLTTDDESIMLNLSPDKLSVDFSNPLDFTEWLEKNYEEPRNFENLVSRPQYGKYLQERLAPYFEHKQVHHIQEEVEDLHVIEGQDHFLYDIQTSGAWSETSYDAVFLSIGHPPYNNFYDLIGKENYIHNPYPMNETLMELDPSKKIGIIGSGATGVDLMRFFDTHYTLEEPLTYYDIKEPFHFVKIPYEKKDVNLSFSMEWIEQQKELYEGFLPLSVVLELFYSDMAEKDINIQAVYEAYQTNDLATAQKAIESNDQKLAYVQEYINRLIVFLPHLYNALDAEDRDVYMDKYYRVLDFFKSLVPYETYKWLIDLVDAEKVRSVADTKEITSEEDGSFTIERTDGTIEHADVLINASGFNFKLSELAKRSTLLHNLYNKKLIEPHRNGNFVFVNWPDANVVNQRFGTMKNLFFTGLLIGGTQHANNDAPLTMRQAIYSANAFMNRRSKE